MIGQRILKLRTDMGMTQAQVAKAINLSPKMISFYERGQRFPPQHVIVKLADLFGVSADYLLGREDFVVNAEVDEWIEAFKEAGLTPADFKKMNDEQRKAISLFFKNFLND